jgi:hypothetical protein
MSDHASVTGLIVAERVLLELLAAEKTQPRFCSPMIRWTLGAAPALREPGQRLGDARRANAEG